jgi:hypothetical protein
VRHQEPKFLLSRFCVAMIVCRWDFQSKFSDHSFLHCALKQQK